MLPLAVVERIARKAGVERISAEAIKELERTIEKIAEEIIKETSVVAKHAKRRTIKPEDIKIAAGKI